LKNKDSTKNEEQYMEQRKKEKSMEWNFPLDDEHEKKKNEGKEKSITYI
jgi:hypothetical protein